VSERTPLTTALLNEHFLTLGVVLTEDQVRAWTRRDEALVGLCGTMEQRCNELAATKRDHFAGLAMQGLLSDYRVGQSICDDEKYNCHNFAELVARSAVEFADALLKALATPPEERQRG
jgi:hypothetical protein